MALLECNDCKREVSDQATACPSCGRPVAAGHAEVLLVPPPTPDAPSCRPGRMTATGGTLAVLALLSALFLPVRVGNVVSDDGSLDCGGSVLLDGESDADRARDLRREMGGILAESRRLGMESQRREVERAYAQTAGLPREIESRCEGRHLVYAVAHAAVAAGGVWLVVTGLRRRRADQNATYFE